MLKKILLACLVAVPLSIPSVSLSRAIDDYGRNLSNHEMLGGHTKARHVNKSDNYLRSRCRAERKRWGKMTSFHSTRSAEKWLSKMIKNHRSYISSYAARWHNNNVMNNNRGNVSWYQSTGRGINCAKLNKRKYYKIPTKHLNYVLSAVSRGKLKISSKTPNYIIVYRELDTISSLNRYRGVIARKNYAAGGWYLKTAYPY